MNKQPDLFSFADKTELSLIDKIKEYIKKGNIKYVSLKVDYDEFEIIDISKSEWWDGNFKYGAKFLLKGFNYKVWSLAVSSSDLEEFFKKAEKVFSPDRAKHFRNVANNHNITTLKEFKERFIYEPRKIILIEADSIDEIKEIANDCYTFQKQVKNHPEMLEKRNIRKICNLFIPKEKIGIEIGESY